MLQSSFVCFVDLSFCFVKHVFLDFIFENYAFYVFFCKLYVFSCLSSSSSICRCCHFGRPSGPPGRTPKKDPSETTELARGAFWATLPKTFIADHDGFGPPPKKAVRTPPAGGVRRGPEGGDPEGAKNVKKIFF